jgi:hypothetical protein
MRVVYVTLASLRHNDTMRILVPNFADMLGRNPPYEQN